jgi:threonine dehydrogenase-like Zn-dependent dehydrogenase
MRAVQLFAPGDVRCVEVDVPQIKNGNDVIIKVKSCGVCGSDIPRVMSKGAYRYPITIGHEFAGQVTEVGPEVNQLGDRVTIMPLIPCGKCKYCRIGEAVLCDDYQYYGPRIDGAMAEYISACADNILKLPSGVDYESGCMTDPVSVALHAVRKVDIQAGQTAIVGVDAAIELAESKFTQVQAIQAVRKMGTVVFCGISYDDLVLPNKVLQKILRGYTIYGFSENFKVIGAGKILMIPHTTRFRFYRPRIFFRHPYSGNRYAFCLFDRSWFTELSTFRSLYLCDRR